MALLQIASVRLLTDGLGQEAYSVYALLLGLAAWYALSDFGIPTAVQNLVSSARAQSIGYEDKLRAFTLILMLGCATFIVLAWSTAPLVASILMNHFPGVSSQDRLDALRLMASLTALLAASTMIYKIWYAEKRGYLAHLMQLLAALCGYGATAGLMQSNMSDKLVWSVFAYYGFNALVPTVCLLARLGRRDGGGCSGRAWICLSTLREILPSAGAFWGYAILASFILQLDYALIAYFLGAEDIVVYSIYTRIFGFGFFVYSSLLSALWPHLAEHSALREGEKIRGLLHQHIGAGLLFMGIFTLLVGMFDSRIIGFVSPLISLRGSTLFVMSLGLYYLVRVWSDTYSVALQSMGKVSFFYTVAPAQALASVTFQALGSRWLGLAGVPLGMAASFVVTVAWLVPRETGRQLREMGVAP